MSNKTIQINPVFLNTSSSKAKIASANNSNSTKTLKKVKPLATTMVQPNKLKKQLLAKIKDFQVKAEEKGLTHEESKKQHEEEFDKEFNDEFNKSLNFLQELSKQKGEQHQQKKEHRSTLKREKIENQVHMHVATELPMELRQPMQMPQMQMPVHQLAKTPPYGILKQGAKPTFREWHNTTQKLHHPLNEHKPLIIIERDETPQTERSKMLETIKQDYNQNKYNNAPIMQPPIMQPPIIQPPIMQPPIMQPPIMQPPIMQPPSAYGQVQQMAAPPCKKRITKTTKYKLGKTKGGNKVSVLIKNNQTRKKVMHEIGLLKQKPILDIKNYLREKNLLKVGSFAPNDVLRQIYEQSILAGDIENKGKDTLIHNFYNDKPN